MDSVLDKFHEYSSIEDYYKENSIEIFKELLKRFCTYSSSDDFFEKEFLHIRTIRLMEEFDYFDIMGIDIKEIDNMSDEEVFKLFILVTTYPCLNQCTAMVLQKLSDRMREIRKVYEQNL